MSIRNMESFIGSLPDWNMLDGCFGQTKISPTDIDGMVERKGVCLFLEHKRNGAALTQGQARAFETLARQGNTIIVFWGEGKAVQKLRVIRPGNLGCVRDATLDSLRKEVSDWYHAVEGGIKPEWEFSKRMEDMQPAERALALEIIKTQPAFRP